MIEKETEAAQIKGNKTRRRGFESKRGDSFFKRPFVRKKYTFFFFLGAVMCDIYRESHRDQTFLPADCSTSAAISIFSWFITLPLGFAVPQHRRGFWNLS
jgi:hypothetical protein